MGVIELEKLTRINQLLGFYQSLLTDKQQQMLQLYYEEDFSLSEIADHYAISRQAVRDNLKRAEHALEHYEAQLHLLSRREQRLQLIEQLAVQGVTPDIIKQLREMDQ